jgi:hypothetical protein
MQTILTKEKSAVMGLLLGELQVNALYSELMSKVLSSAASAPLELDLEKLAI